MSTIDSAQPSDVARAQLLKGEGLLRQGKLDPAAQVLIKAIELAPGFADAHERLGTVYLLQGRFDDAAVQFEQLALIQPKRVRAHCMLGAALGNGFRLEQAVVAYDRALAIDADSVDAAVGKAVVLEQRGEYQAAYELLVPLVAKGEGGADLAYAFATISHHVDRVADALELVERTLALSDVPPVQRKGLHFKAGAMYDRSGAYDQAFDHYRSGNELSRVPFDRPRQVQWTDRLITAFSESAMPEMARAPDASNIPIFIVGMPRSGTSLVEQILVSHPKVHGGGELREMARIADLVPATLGNRAPFPECIDRLSANGAATMSRRYAGYLEKLSAGTERVTDKMPQNFFFVGLMTLLFPKAPIIHCQRNPVDTCLSCYFQPFSEGHEYAHDLEDLGFYHRQYQRLMDHWQRVLPRPMLSLSYDNLVADPEPMVRELLAFCGLEWDPACMDFHRSKRVVATASYDQVRQPIHQRSVARWQRYEAHLAPLLEALGDNP